MPQNETRFHLKLTAFGDVHGVTHLQGQEALSELYYYDIQFAVSNHSSQPDLAALIDSTALLTLDPEFAENPDSRMVHGIVQSIRFVRDDHRFHHYELRLSPQLWRLTQQSDNRIFQFKDVQTIITDVLKDAGFAGDDYQFIFQEPHPEREYCVQYRETHLEFLERLMAEEGIYYTFTHEAARHTLVMTDTPTKDTPITGDSTLKYRPPGGPEHQYETITHFGVQNSVRTGKFVHTDYDFKNPALELEQNFAGDTFTNLERYDYQGRYVDPARGGKLSQFRLEQHQADQHIGIGQSNSVRLQTGHQFSLDQHEISSHNDKYLITGLTIQAQQPQVLGEAAGITGTTGQAGDSANATTYHCQFHCIPSTVPFRPPYTADKPHVNGPHAAIVVGPEGEEIYVDEHGRVKVQFHWDRIGEDNEHSSVWMRVSQGWAGAAWGNMFIPRIGHEVIVDFLEGDIDRPIITGRVYHGTNVPPYPLPEHKTKSVMRSDTHKGDGFNELTFEDEAGQEEIYIHAQKDERIVVNNDAFETIGHDRHLTVTNDQVEEVQNDLHHTTRGNKMEQVDGTNSLTVKSDQMIEVTGNNSLKVGANAVIEAGSQITFKVGGSFITITGGEIAIKSPSILLNSGGSAGSATAPQLPMQPVPDEVMPSQGAECMQKAAQAGSPFCEDCAA